MKRRLIADTPLHTLQAQLASAGVFVAMPPFVVHIRSGIAVVAEGLHRMYAGQHWWAEEGEFADFRVEVRARRRWLRPMCEFQADGLQPFTPLALGEAFAMLEWGLNWCITGYCHHWLALHAAVLERGGRAVILPAPPGSGKSTLCASLMAHGWRLLSDELALIDPSTGLLTPCPRPISLKNASIDILRQRLPHVPMGPVAHDTLKGTVCHLQVNADSLARAAEPAMPGWVIFPRYQSGAPLSLQPRGKAEALLELQRNAFNRHVHGHRGFEVLADLVTRTGVYDFTYSQIDEALACFDALAAEQGAA